MEMFVLKPREVYITLQRCKAVMHREFKEVIHYFWLNYQLLCTCTVDLVIFACLDFREFVIFGLHEV